ncbi:MAG: chloride channel protein [Alphaproteobacteria bacterium]|nr:chloride channel protein [Alphaproteobacteria bacterium]
MTAEDLAPAGDRSRRARLGGKLLGPLQMALMALAVGALVGVGAAVFRALVALIHNLMVFGEVSLIYEPTQYSAPSSWGLWLAVVPVIGGMVNLWLKRLTPGGGHGVPDVILSLHHRDGQFQIGGSLLKVVATGFSSGSGASVGREGATVLIGAASATFLARLIPISHRQRLVLLAAASGAGLGAAFNAPLAGTLFALEVLLAELSPGLLLPLLLASVAANTVGRLLGFADPEFAVITATSRVLDASGVAGLAIYAVFGGVLGLVALGFMRFLDDTEAVLARLFPNPYLRHGVAMAAVGVLIVSMMTWFGHYYLLGAGYATVHRLAAGAEVSIAFLGLLFVVKLLATALSLGSGATGGVFSATLFLGGALGGALGLFLHQYFPGLGISPGTAAIVGMAGLLAGTTGAALFSIVLSFEVTSDYGAVLPVALAAVAAIGVRRLFTEGTIYTAKLRAKGFAVPEALVPDFLSLQHARDVADPLPAELPDHSVAVPGEASLAAVTKAMAAAKVDYAVVVDGTVPVGIIGPATLGRALIVHQQG